jgi:hypothetical protein
LAEGGVPAGVALGGVVAEFVPVVAAEAVKVPDDTAVAEGKFGGEFTVAAEAGAVDVDEAELAG